MNHREPSAWWALARHEIRVCVRMQRTRLILVITSFLCAWYFIVLTLHHMQLSGIFPGFGVLSPRYAASVVGSSFLALYCSALLLLAFDSHARDERNHIREVLATKPVHDMQFIAGRLLGIFVLLGLPMFIVVILACVYGLVSDIFSIPFGEHIEPWSLISFLVLDIIPNFLFFGSLVLLLAAFVRPRFIALLLSLMCLFGLMWVNDRLPLDVAASLQTVTGNVIFPSELTPTLYTWEIFFNRIAMILVGMGCLYWTAAFYPRSSTSTNHVRNGVGVVSLGIVLLGTLIGGNLIEQYKIGDWKRAHDAHFEPSSFPDIHQITGAVNIYPDRHLVLDLELMVSVTDELDGDYVIFSLNPGYRIQALELNGVRVTDHDFQNGLLKVQTRYFGDNPTTLKLVARGKPESRFAYLDSHERIAQRFGPEVRQLRFLGTDNYIFDPRFVVLMPGVHWYPTAGTATNVDSWERRAKDFFQVNVEVSVPRKWIVAGPTKREKLDSSERAHFRFQTDKPLPHFALVAAPFQHLSADIDGVSLEVLYHKKHRHNIEFFAPVAETVQAQFQGHLKKMREVGLEYPYSVFSLVEVPASLRVFGGGKTIASVLGMPGLLMMPETTFPTMYLESLHEPSAYQPGVSMGEIIAPSRRDRMSDEEWMKEKVTALHWYFSQSLYAGSYPNFFFGSLFSQQVGATGENAEFLLSILDQTILDAFGESGGYDVDLALDLDVLDLTQFDLVYILNIFDNFYEESRRNKSDAIFFASGGVLSSNEVLDAIELPTVPNIGSTASQIIERRAKMRQVHIASELLHDLVGTDALTSIVSELIEDYRGRNVSYDEFIQIARAQNPDIDRILENLIDAQGLPGFVLTDVSQETVATDVSDEVVFHTSFTLHNGEPFPGYCTLFAITSQWYRQYELDYLPNTPLFVEPNQSLEIVVESESPVRFIVVKPYQALNRDELVVPVPVDEEFTEPSNVAPEIVSIRDKDGDPFNQGKSIVIDDLDPGFSVVGQSNWLVLHPITLLARGLAGGSVNETIRGLPKFQFDQLLVPFDTWERLDQRTAYGKYWKTFTLNRGGEGKTFAQFSTTLPESGVWRLDYFQPPANVEITRKAGGRTSSVATYLQKGDATIDVHVNATIQTTLIKTADVPEGWNTVGEYQVENPEVEVHFSNHRKRRAVFADAIRWTPVTAAPE